MFFYYWKAVRNDFKFFFRFINCSRIIYLLEHQKVLKFLKEASDSKFVTRKWNVVKDDSKLNYGTGNEIIHNTEVLEYNLTDY